MDSSGQEYHPKTGEAVGRIPSTIGGQFPLFSALFRPELSVHLGIYPKITKYSWGLVLNLRDCRTGFRYGEIRNRRDGI